MPVSNDNAPVSVPAQTGETPLVTWEAEALVKRLGDHDRSTIAFLKNLARELRESGFPDASIHVVSQERESRESTTTYLFKGVGDDIKITDTQHKKSENRIAVMIPGEEQATYRDRMFPSFSLWTNTFVLAVGALVFSLSASIIPSGVILLSTACQLFAGYGAELARTRSPLAALRNMGQHFALERTSLLDLRSAILRQAATLLIAQSRETGNPPVLNASRRTLALREIEGHARKLAKDVPQLWITPPEQKALPAPAADPFAAADERIAARRTQELSARFSDLAAGLSLQIEKIADPGIKTATQGFLDLFNRGAECLSWTDAARPLRRAELLLGTLAQYNDPKLSDPARAALAPQFSNAVAAAREELQEEIVAQDAARVAALAASLRRLENDHI